MEKVKNRGGILESDLTFVSENENRSMETIKSGHFRDLNDENWTFHIDAFHCQVKSNERKKKTKKPDGISMEKHQENRLPPRD